MAEEYDPTIVAPVLFQVPISALGTASRQELSSSLNDIKVILSPSDKYRDWRGVLSYMKLDRSCCDFEKEGGDYMSRLLSVWDSEGESASLGTLKEILGEIDRWDVVEDTARLFDEDARVYLEKQSQMEEYRRSVDAVETARVEMRQQHYDAFVLATDRDFEKHVIEIIDEMTSRGLSVCHRDDLLAGTNEFEAIHEVIANYCNQVIMVFTPEFRKSPELLAFVSHAQSTGIKGNIRKVIPCMYGTLTKHHLPETLRSYGILRYGDPDFWSQLERSIKNDPVEIMEIPSKQTRWQKDILTRQTQTTLWHNLKSLMQMRPITIRFRQ